MTALEEEDDDGSPRYEPTEGSIISSAEFSLEDTLYDMEQVLLDGGENREIMWGISRGLYSPAPVYNGIWKVDTVEVLPLQVKSFTFKERLYTIRVNSGKHQWEVTRSYRDFIELSQLLKGMFSGIFVLPSPWDSVPGEAEFWNPFWNSQYERRALLEACLQSALQAGIPLSSAAPLLKFLFPGSSQKSDSGSDVGEQQLCLQFGRIIRLVVQIQEMKPLKEQLSIQRHVCAGCYKKLSLPSGIISSILNRDGPRLCEYTGQVFCSDCHLNEEAIIPARVLQEWDFTPRSVCHLVKTYLNSIENQPMFCISALNPRLYSKVPALTEVKEMKRKLRNVAGCVVCPSLETVGYMLGSRSYLLRQSDFFSLRDLFEVSRLRIWGCLKSKLPYVTLAELELPELMKTTIDDIETHIRQCSVCKKLGETCGDGSGCKQLIYPYEVMLSCALREMSAGVCYVVHPITTLVSKAHATFAICKSSI